MTHTRISAAAAARDLQGALSAVAHRLIGVVEDAVEAVCLASARSLTELGREAGVPTLEPPADAGRLVVEELIGVVLAGSAWAGGHPTWGVALCAAWARLVCSLAADADVAINLRAMSPTDWVCRTERQYGLSALAGWASRIAAIPGLGCALYRSAAAANGARLIDLATDPLSSDPRTDIPAMPPRITTPPVWAGIDRATFSCHIPDENDTGYDRSLTAHVQVLLPVTARGAHMSRLQEILVDLHGRRFTNPATVALFIAERAMAAQPALAAICDVSGSLMVATVAPITRHKSTVRVTESARVRVRQRGAAHGSLTLTTAIATACPCTLTYSRLRAAQAIGTDHPGLPPTFTHMQPGTVHVEVAGDVADLPTSADLLDAAAQAAHLRHSVLKRPDEHDLVERVHRRPQFAEDVCRAVGAAVAARLTAATRVRVTAVVDESIHPHRAVASVAGHANQFWSA